MLGGAVLLMVVGALVPRRARNWWHAAFTVVTALASAAAWMPLWFRARDDGAMRIVADAFRVDGLTVFLGIVMCAAVALTALLAHGYLRREKLDGPEPYVLLMLSAAGGQFMLGANDLLVLFIALEILSIAVYVLAGIHIRRARSGEAAFKYLILGGMASAVLLYGIALIYGATGSTNLTDVQVFLSTNLLTNNLFLLAGMAMILVGLGFKVGAAPFHAWAPDVYEGSPSPVVAYMASGVKVAGFAALVRVFVVAFGNYRGDWQPVVYVVAVLTLGVVVRAWSKAVTPVPDPGLGLTLLGWALMGLGSALALAAVLRFGGSGFLGLTQERNVGLVRSGLHGRVRHPIYLGVLVALAGWLIVSWIPATWVVVAITVLYLPIGIRLEEHKLIAEFGEDYRRYRREVPALFPRLVPQR
ncbi:MAG TPA: proton-conducting transporter membrane subunit, partial [Flavobacteriales bacterium]|nr:proton-conducting transporter membrane subunit [Flavobacteriales bacterium]